LNADDDGKPEEVGRPQRDAVIDQKGGENWKAQAEVYKAREHHHDRKHFRRKQDLLDQIAAGNQHI
jgi:hypothetical protein